MLKFIHVIAGAALLSAMTACTALADHEPHIPTLTVTGSAVISAAPDQATIRLAVLTEGKDASDVARDNARLAKEIQRALIGAGASEDDIETTGFSVEPVYNYRNRTNDEPPQIVGYRVSNEVQVTTLDLDNTGELIGAGIEAGANRVSGLQFDLRDNSAQRAQAIAEATAAARADAEALAAAAGIELDGVHEINLIPSYNQPVQREFAGRSAMAMDAAPPVSPGDIQVRAQVNLVYRISGG